MDTDPTQLTDEELMTHVMEQDAQAYSEIVRRHTKKYYSLSYRLLSDRESAEDAVQDSFLMLWNTPGKWDPSKNVKFTTWFYRVVTNACLDKKRKYRYETPEQSVELESNERNQEEAVVLKRAKDKIESLIQQLPENQQTALTLCFYEGLSNKEASAVMDLSVKAVESLLMRAKASLRNKIGTDRKTEVA